MSSLLAHWPYQRVPCLPFMEFQNGDRVQHYLGSVGTVEGYDHHAPGYFYVQFEDEVSRRFGPSRIPSSSLEKVDG